MGKFETEQTLGDFVSELSDNKFIERNHIIRVLEKGKDSANQTAQRHRNGEGAPHNFTASYFAGYVAKYVFDDSALSTKEKKLFEVARSLIPPYVSEEHTYVPQLYIGGIGSGAPYHHHGAAMNLLMHGVKDWYLLPPAQAAFTNLDNKEHLEGFDSNAFVCRQQSSPGEVVLLWLPPEWAHRTINRANWTVGFAQESER